MSTMWAFRKVLLRDESTVYVFHWTDGSAQLELGRPGGLAVSIVFTREEVAEISSALDRPSASEIEK